MDIPFEGTLGTDIARHAHRLRLLALWSNRRRGLDSLFFWSLGLSVLLLLTGKVMTSWGLLIIAVVVLSFVFALFLAQDNSVEEGSFIPRHISGVVTDWGIRFETPDRSELPWSSFFGASVRPEEVLLHRKDVSELFPSSFFRDHKDWARFQDLVRSNVPDRMHELLCWTVLITHPLLDPKSRDGEVESLPMGDADEVRLRVSRVFPGVDWSNPEEGIFKEKTTYSIEFELSATGPIRCLALSVRGDGDPLPGIVSLCRENGWRALDLSTTEPLDLEAPSRTGWNQYHAQRNEGLLPS